MTRTRPVFAHHKRAGAPPVSPSLLALTLALALGAITGLSPTGASAMPDTPTNRRAQAIEYERAVPVERMLDASIAQMAALLPPEHRAPFTENARQEINPEPLRGIMLESLTETFSADELAAMAAFFGSDEGRSVATKMTRYMHRVMPPMLEQVQAAATRYAKEQSAPQ